MSMQPICSSFFPAPILLGLAMVSTGCMLGGIIASSIRVRKLYQAQQRCIEKFASVRAPAEQQISRATPLSKPIDIQRDPRNQRLAFLLDFFKCFLSLLFFPIAITFLATRLIIPTRRPL